MRVLTIGVPRMGLCQGPAAEFFDPDGNPGAGELGREVEGEDRTTKTDTDTWGISLQSTFAAPWLGHDNSLTIGFSYDRSDTDFRQNEAEAELFEQGLSRGTQRIGDLATEVDINSTQENWGIYLTDTFDITEQFGLTFSGRYQITEIKIADRTGEEENADLNGHHDFNRFNPAVGTDLCFFPGA